MAPTLLRITDVHRSTHFAYTRNRYHLRLFQLKSLTGSTPRRTGKTAHIHHQAAARTSRSCPAQSLVINVAAPKMANVRNSNSCVDLLPSSLIRAPKSCGPSGTTSLVRSRLSGPGCITFPCHYSTLVEAPRAMSHPTRSQSEISGVHRLRLRLALRAS